jgi:hypothetical protein
MIPLVSRFEPDDNPADGGAMRTRTAKSEPGGCVNTRSSPIIEHLSLWQSEKSMTNSINTTRRGFLSIAAALAASAAVAIPANAANASGADPIFEAIELHKATRLAFENAVSRGSALDEELPSEKTRSCITVWEQTIIETDDPRWIDSVNEVHRASDAETDAACALVNIVPTTMAGVVALLQYVISIRPEEWPEGVHSDDDTESRPWHFFLIEMLAAVLPGMAVQS